MSRLRCRSGARFWRAAGRSELLEPRRLLAAVNWDGGGDNVSWRDPLNWSFDQIPTSSDDVAIDTEVTPLVAITAGVNAVRSLTCSAGLTLSGGFFTVATASSIAGPFTMTASGYLGGAGNFTIAAAADITGGTMAVGGKTVVADGAVAVFSGSAIFNLSRSFEIDGSVEFQGTNEIAMNSAIITNNGVVEITGNASARFSNTTGVNQFVNNATVTNSSPLAVATFNVPISNYSIVDVVAGSVTFGRTLTHFGTLNIASDARVNFNSSASYSPGSKISGPGDCRFLAGSHLLEPGQYLISGKTTVQGAIVTANVPISSLDSTLSGNGTFKEPVNFAGPLDVSGTFRFSSSTSTLFSSARLRSGVAQFDLPLTLTVGSLNLDGGTLNTPGDVVVSTDATFRAGSILGEGVLVLLPTSVGSFAAGSTTWEKDLQIRGDAGVIATHTIRQSGSVLSNSGSMTLYSAFVLDNTAGSNRLENSGTIEGVGPTLRVPVINGAGGLIVAHSGTLTLSGPGTSLTNSGGITVDVGATLKLGTSILLPGSIIEGGGTTDFVNGSLNTIDSFNFAMTGPWVFSGGSVTVNLPRVFTAAQSVKGTVAFTRPVTFQNTSTFSGATTFSGTVLFQGNATFTGPTRIESAVTFSAQADFGALTVVLAPSTFSGKVSIRNRLDLSTPGSVFSFGDVAFYAGTLGGSSNVAINGTVTNSGGMTMDGEATTTIAIGASLNVGGRFDLARPLINNGVAYFPHEIQDIYFHNATFTNNGEFRAAGGGTIDRFINVEGINLFINNGVFNYGGDSSHNIYVEIPFENHGTVNVAGGELNFVSTTNAGSGAALSGGKYIVSPYAGAELNFTQPLTTLTADIEASGTLFGLQGLSINRGRLALMNGFDYSITPTGGTLVNEGSLELSAGSLLNVTETLAFAGGSQPSVLFHISTISSFGKITAKRIDLNSPDSTSTLRIVIDGSYNPPINTALSVLVATQQIDNAFDSFSAPPMAAGKEWTVARPDEKALVIVVDAAGTPGPIMLSANFVQVNDQALVVQFDRNARPFLSRKDFILTNLGTGIEVTQASGTLAYNVLTNEARLVLTNQLPDGRYRASIAGSAIANGAGVPALGPDQLVDFEVLRGDVTQDGVVNFDDLLIVAQNYGSPQRTFAQGNVDFSTDGLVGFDDLLLLAQQYGRSISSIAPITTKRKTDKKGILV